jgi:hypothetical protein
MAYEKNSGLRVHNQYGPRSTGGEQGVHKTEGYKNEYVVDQASVLPYLFPRGGGVFVTGHDDTFVSAGAVTSITIGGLEVIGATETAPIKIPDTNTGEVVVTGMTAGREVIFFKKSAGYEADVLPAWPGAFADAVSISVTPTTKTLSLSGVNTATLVATVLPAGADQAVIWKSSDPTKATVSSSGLITGVAAGTSNVTATSVADGSLVATCVVTVTA